MSDEGVDVQLIAEKMAACLQDDQVNLQIYVEAYTELCKFFTILGKVFGFVLSDVKTKLDILSSHLNSDLKEHYSTVETMTEYEIANDLTHGKVNGLANGSRTFLRLHRALQFITSFLEKVEQVSDDENLSQHSIDAYNQSLKQYHPWIIQKAATLAMKTLGTRVSLLAGTKQDREECLIYLKQLIANCNAVYDNVQYVYEEKGILDLP